MKNRPIPKIILIGYSAAIIDVMVFKNLPVIRIGRLRFNFGGTKYGPANLVPLRTILPYLLGHRGFSNAVINLAGNIFLLVPIGFLAPMVYSDMTWKKSLVLAITAGLTIELSQLVFCLGIFDVDDLMLNALGVMIGYWVGSKPVKWIHSPRIAGSRCLPKNTRV